MQKLIFKLIIQYYYIKIVKHCNTHYIIIMFTYIKTSFKNEFVDKLLFLTTYIFFNKYTIK